MNYLIKKFGKDKRWVNYRMQKMGDRITKIPYSVTGRKASSVNPDDWSTFSEAKASSENVGIVFTPAQDVLGIDIDHCLTNKQITHEQKETIAELILEADTYTEFSPSGEGLHLILKIKGSLPLTSNKKAPYEAYTSGRYFTFTGNCYGEPKPVRTVVPEEALKILSIIGYPWNQQEGTTPLVQTNGQTMINEEILSRMFNSKTGKKIKNLFDGDISEYKNDASSADMALCSHLAFWTGKNKEQIEEIWLNSPLGSREKTKERQDYRNRTIRTALLSCKEVYQNPENKPSALELKKVPELDLLYISGPKGSKIYLKNTENMCRILSCHRDFANRFRYDAFKNVYEIKKSDNTWRPLEDNDDVMIQTAISILFPEWFGNIGKNMIHDAIIKVSKENEIDSAKDYLVSLTWDKTERLNTWLSKVYGVTNDMYHQAVASNWMKGLVKRIIEPGCKFDYVLVLEGPQGSRKSTSLAILGDNWHVETAMSTESKDFFMQFQGKAIIEFSEGETLSRTEVKRMKAIITMQSDRYRPPYDRTSQDFPRRCVFAMTTNQSEYLKDETGNRRWLPVAINVEEADTQWLKENRDQLFAEAYHRVKELRETIYEFPKEETFAAQQARQVQDPNADLVWEWFHNGLKKSERDDGITIFQVYKEVLHGGFTPGKPMTKYDEMSIAGILRLTLGLVKKQRMINGIRATKWFREEVDIESLTEKKEADLIKF